MKSIVSSVMLAAAVLTVACQTADLKPGGAHPLEGNWELVSARFTAPDGTVSEFNAPRLRSLKILGPTRFVFITVREDGSLARAAGGRYTVRGNQYTEHIDLTSAPPLEGDYHFQWRVEGDTWHHSGEHNGQRFDEVWRRAR